MTSRSQNLSDTSVDTSSSLSALTGPSRGAPGYVAALASRDSTVQDLHLSSGTLSAFTRKGAAERNLEGYLAVSSQDRLVLGVVNGLGNSEPGAFACRIVGASLIRSTREERGLQDSLRDASALLAKAVKDRPEEVVRQSGACVALAEIQNGSVTFSHLGNCRALLVRPAVRSSGELIFASADHVTTSSVPGHSPAAVTRAISPLRPNIAADIDRSSTFELNSGDQIILLSGGATRSINNQQLLQLVQSELSIISVSNRSADCIATSNIAAEISLQSELSDDYSRNDKVRNRTVLVFKYLDAGPAGR